MSRPIPTREDITGVILAGGQGRRMGGLDKGLVPCGGRPMIEWVMERLRPQVGQLLISANRNLDHYARYGVPVVCDREPGFLGPLAGIASAMAAARTDWILTAPCDGPLLPDDLATRLIAAVGKSGAEAAVASDREGLQPLYALLPVAFLPVLTEDLKAGARKAERWISDRRPGIADFGHEETPFANVNSPSEATGIGRRLQDPRVD